MDLIDYVEEKEKKKDPINFRPGDTVRVYASFFEGDRKRVQPFEGVVIRIRRRGLGTTFTVRRVSYGIGVERIFPYYSPCVEKVEIIRRGKVRRAKLYYLREKIGKKAKVKERREWKKE